MVKSKSLGYKKSNRSNVTIAFFVFPRTLCSLAYFKFKDRLMGSF